MTKAIHRESKWQGKTHAEKMALKKIERGFRHTARMNYWAKTQLEAWAKAMRSISTTSRPKWLRRQEAIAKIL